MSQSDEHTFRRDFPVLAAEARRLRPGPPRLTGPGSVYWAPSGADPNDPRAWVYLGEMAVCGECGSSPCASTCPAHD